MGLAFLDRDLRYIRINDALAATHGLPRAAHIGKRLSELFPEELHFLPLIHEVERQMQRVLDTGEPRLEVELSGETPAAPGKRRVWLVSWYPVRVAGELVGIGAVVREITEQKQNEEFRRHVLAIVGHDLRTPLSAITLSAEALSCGDPLTELQARFVTRIQASGKRMSLIVRDLLDYTRVRTGEALTMEPREADLSAVCRQVLEEAEAAHPERSFQLESSDERRGFWDPDRLAQALSNLVTNAASYSPPGTPVIVRCDSDGDEVAIEVENQGAPIDPALLPHIFEPFRHGDQRKAGRSGLGLGLFITYEIVRAHGGRIDVESGEGRIVFRLSLPRGLPSPRAA